MSEEGRDSRCRLVFSSSIFLVYLWVQLAKKWQVRQIERETYIRHRMTAAAGVPLEQNWVRWPPWTRLHFLLVRLVKFGLFAVNEADFREETDH